MKTVLLPICEREYSVVQGRITYLAQSLSKDFIVEFITNSKEVYGDAHKKLDGYTNIRVKHIESKHLPLTFDFRNSLAKIFLQYTNDICIPNTGLKLWKTAAFDDFWGHVSTIAFPEIQVSGADIVLVPLLSYDETPWEDTDVLYTSVIYSARELGVQVVGYQLYPVFNGLKLMPYLMDTVVVRSDYERQFYIQMGIASEQLHLLTDPRDMYALSSIEDVYQNHLYNSQIEIRRDELAIVVCNHQKLRPQILDVLRTIAKMKLPIVLTLIKREYQVKDLTEDEILKGVLFKEIEKIGCRFYLVENSSLVPMIMVSDVVISPAYIVPLAFAARQKKKSFVYNPCDRTTGSVDGVRFITTPEGLFSSLKEAHAEKTTWTGMRDVLMRLG